MTSRRLWAIGALALSVVLTGGALAQWEAAFITLARTRASALDAIPAGPFMAIDAAAWRYLSGRPVVVTPADGEGALACTAAIYGARSVVLEAAHFRAYDGIYNGSERYIWLGQPIVRDSIKIFPVTGLAGCSIGKLP